MCVKLLFQKIIFNLENIKIFPQFSISGVQVETDFKRKTIVTIILESSSEYVKIYIELPNFCFGKKWEKEIIF